MRLQSETSIRDFSSKIIMLRINVSENPENFTGCVLCSIYKMLQLLRAPIPTMVEAAFVRSFCKGRNIHVKLKYLSEGMTCFEKHLTIDIVFKITDTVTVMYFSTSNQSNGSRQPQGGYGMVGREPWCDNQLLHHNVHSGRWISLREI